MKILIRGTNWIGDAVMTIPAITHLRRAFPEAGFTALTSPATVELLRDTGLFDEVAPTRSIARDARFMRRRRFDIAVLFPNSLSSALSVRLGGARRIVGYATDRRSPLLTDAVPVPDWKDTRHEVFYYLNLVQTVTVDAPFESAEVLTPEEPRLTPNVSAHEQVSELLQRIEMDPRSKLVILAPGSTNSRAKRWLPERFAQVNDMLRETGVQVVLLGSPGDRDVSSRVVELSKHRPLDLTGETDISAAAALLARADLLISNDMGLAHLAPAVGTKTIVIFGPTNQVTTRPFSELAQVVSANVECSPCMRRDCPIDHRCMTRISADDVFAQARKLLML